MSGASDEHRPSPRTARAVIGIDTGGTFTDLVGWIDGRLVVRKVLSSPADPADAVLRVLGELADSAAVVVHGTTVATNALLERRGARVALVTTAGFEDVVEIGRQARPDPYALEPRRPPPLVPRELRFGITGPLSPDDGDRLPEAAELDTLLRRLADSGVEAVAVCMLFGYLDDEAERRAQHALAFGAWQVSISSRVLPVFREYERTSTTVANAYVAPRMSGYLTDLAARAPSPRWSVMASNAGSLDLDTAAALPAACLLSGPAGGVLGAARVAARLGIDTALTLDMGGTSTDVCLVEGDIPTSDAAEVAGLPIAFPTVDIHTVGAGGGSIIRLDRAGVLRVGPQSAGADPGPIVYGRGERPTVTDANVLLGRLPVDTFSHLGAAPEQSLARLRQAFAELAAPLGIDPRQAAQVALDSVEASMSRALRVISTRRGRDPRGAALVCFGGAGPLHGAALAAALGIARVVVPPHPGVLSACGLAGADARRDYVRAVLRAVDERLDDAAITELVAPLREAARRDATVAGGASPELQVSFDLRYRGQSHEIEVEWSDAFVERFHREHERRFGHADRRRPVEMIHARVRAVVEGARFPIETAAERAAVTVAPAGPAGEGAPPPGLARDQLAPGETVAGPLVITEATATTWLPPHWTARVAVCGSLLLVRGGREAT
jgi:N-methylhydantoinase A